MRYLRGRIIDGTVSSPILDGIVLFAGEHISTVGPASAFESPPGESMLDGQGLTVMPGIIDSHTHVGRDTKSRLQSLVNGVTAVCDLGSSLQDMSSDQIMTGTEEPSMARVFRSGPVFTAPGGLPGALFQAGLNLEVRTAEQVRAGVMDLAQRGASIIKVYLDPWAGREFPVLQPDLVRQIVDEAHALGMLVRAHVNKISMLKVTLDAGVDVLEHVPIAHPSQEIQMNGSSKKTGDFFPRFYIEQMAILDDLLPRMVAEEVILVPTLSKLETSLRGSLIPESLQPRIFESALETVNRFGAIGGKIALGTDRNARWEKPFGMPLREMQLLQAAGLSSLDVIVAATSHAADVCGKGEDLGTLEAGKLADILLLDGDPLTDIHALENVVAVYLGGRAVSLPES